ncbi:MAG: NAD+ synthase, partial [Candidatus Omnitrophica bacterium]|nr:NAD+ synthase [Candidatus Omnitrophota bacterium]MBD3268556.1 NAD+ synthase [Candidatus Omnitrophota bacterium]
MLRIGLAQVNPRVGALEDNYKIIISFIEEARKKDVELLIFPELALTGYPPEDLLLKNHFIDKNIRIINRLKSRCREIGVLIGFVNKKDNHIYNSCALIHQKKIKDIY